MSYYKELKKLDEESLAKLQEGPGPSDKCICNLLSLDEPDRMSIAASLMSALGLKKKKKSLNDNLMTAPGITKRRGNVKLNKYHRNVNVPMTGLKTTREVVKRKFSCGKCGCDDNPTVLRHSYANIRITSPDLSSVCPCSSDCFPDKKNLDSIKVIVENAQIGPTPNAVPESAQNNGQSDLHLETNQQKSEPEI